MKLGVTVSRFDEIDLAVQAEDQDDFAVDILVAVESMVMMARSPNAPKGFESAPGLLSPVASRPSHCKRTHR